MIKTVNSTLSPHANEVLKFSSAVRKPSVLSQETVWVFGNATPLRSCSNSTSILYVPLSENVSK